MPPVSNRSAPAKERDTEPMPGAPKKMDLDEETLYILKQYLRKDQMDEPKLLRFILSYLGCRNVAQAAREADAPGRGSYWRGRPEVHAAIEALTAKMVMKYGYDAGEVIERVKEIASIDPVAFENPDGSYKTHLSQVDPEVRRAIKKFTVKNMYGEDANGMKMVIGQLVSVELWDKLKSLELLGREKNIMKETKRVEHDVTTNMKDLLLESRSRAEARIAGREVIEITGRTDVERSVQTEQVEEPSGDNDPDTGRG